MACPMLTALDAVADAIQAAIDAGAIAVPVRIVKTLLPRQALESIGSGNTVLVYVSAMTRESPSTPWDEYQVSVACQLFTQCNSTEEDPHTQERVHAELSQTIADEVRSRITVSAGYTASTEAGMLDEATLEDLNLISTIVSGTYRIQREIP